MILRNGDRSYSIGDCVAKTALYRLYLCSLTGSNNVYLLQVATDVARNGVLDRATYILGELTLHAEQLEEEYSQVKSDPKDLLNYHFCLPRVIDTFVSPEQGDRRINILSFQNVDDARRMVPLYTIVHKDRRRVDLRTSVWIMGKLLKILAFVHSADVSIGNVSLGNILIEPDQHYVVVFNWASAQKHSDGVPTEIIRKEIAYAAKCVLDLIADDFQSTPDEDTVTLSYFSHIVELAANGARSAVEAHREFYELTDRLWPRDGKKYPFTVLPRG